ncbi:Baculoviral IAP repeat-containing protein 7-B [Portunus trituberculatus]|uniref:Baculoviral IAP repeat-containing protein 7-B n=1 Tax=Portunus trituberculatus TaxID=210409 RepID=A0A5B7FN52_PORTR|nr:Baculoviral IAP repeat-containing protein 7-B [Portunus trituberculatus]
MLCNINYYQQQQHSCCHNHHHHHQQQQQQQQQRQQQQQQFNTTNPSTLHCYTQPPPLTNTSSPTQKMETQRAPSPAAPRHPSAGYTAALKEERARLQEKLVEMKEKRRCVVCLDNEYGAIFMPCTHLVTCPSCAATLSTCPVCRTPVQYLVAVKID